MTRPPLHLSPFGRLLGASAASNLGDGLRLAALPLLAASLTRDPAAVSLMVAVIFLPWLLLGAVGGAVVDRVHRVRLLIGVQLGRMIVVAALAALVWSGNASMPLLYLAAFLFRIGELLADTTMHTLVPALVSNEQLEQANGRLFASQSVANEFVGPPVGSLLFAAVPALPFVGKALAWGGSALVLARLDAPQPDRSGGDPTSLLQDVVAGARWLFAQPTLRALLVWSIFVNGSIAAFTGIQVLYALELLGVSEAVYGFYGAAAGVGGLVATLLAGRLVRRFGRTTVVMGGSALRGLATLLAGLLPHALLFGLLVALMTGGAALIIIVLGSLRQTIVPSRLLGRVTATTRVFGYGALPLGAVLGGWLAGAIDLLAPFLLGGVVIIAAGLLIGRWLTPAAIKEATATARAAA